MSDEYTDHLSILKFIEAQWRLPIYPTGATTTS
jgi:hypothetical protein